MRALIVCLFVCSMQGAEESSQKAVRLLQPFEPQMKGSVPEGWVVEQSERHEPVVRVVESENGAQKEVRVQPYVLKPIADAVTRFGVQDPGFRAEKGYRQTSVEGVLRVQQAGLEATEEELEAVLARLNELLVTLPEADVEVLEEGAGE